MLDGKNQLFTSGRDSLNRPAWTQTLEQGCGSGLLAFKHKQGQGGNVPLRRDYYVRSRGCR